MVKISLVIFVEPSSLDMSIGKHSLLFSFLKVLRFLLLGGFEVLWIAREYNLMALLGGIQESLMSFIMCVYVCYFQGHVVKIHMVLDILCLI